jgi:hypothetical protein
MKRDMESEYVQELQQYLLGELSETGRDRVEERLFTDQDYLDRLSMVEDDLVDSYVRGELKGTTLSRFESHFLSSSRRRDRVLFARAFLSTSHPGHHVRQSARSWLSTLSEQWNWRPVLAVAALAVAVVSSILIPVNRQLERQGRVIADLQAQLSENKSIPTSVTQKEIVAGLRQEIQQELQTIRQTLRSATVTPLSFVLAVGGQRSSQAVQQRLLIPPGDRPIELGLPLQGTEPFPLYRLEIRTPDGALVWSEQQTASKERLTQLTVPSTVLKQGDYVLEVFGTSESGDIESVESSTFRVVSR